MLDLIAFVAFIEFLFQTQKLNEPEKRNNPINAAKRSERPPASGGKATPQMMSLRKQG
jgi:hypothetical protein